MGVGHGRSGENREGEAIVEGRGLVSGGSVRVSVERTRGELGIGESIEEAVGKITYYLVVL